MAITSLVSRQDARIGAQLSEIRNEFISLALLETPQHNGAVREIRVLAHDFTCFANRHFETNRERTALKCMSDAYDYFKAHAIAATQKARALPFGRDKQKQRVVARVYHLLAREAAFTPNVHHLDEFRAAQRLERQVSRRPATGARA
jgi:hypothetical protein